MREKYLKDNKKQLRLNTEEAQVKISMFLAITEL